MAKATSGKSGNKVKIVSVGSYTKKMVQKFLLINVQHLINFQEPEKALFPSHNVSINITYERRFLCH